MKTYRILYDGAPLVDVEIADTEEAHAAIKEMVEFWMGWEQRLKYAGGDYLRCFLLQLGRRAFYAAPSDKDEGWTLDGSRGVKLTYYSPPECDESLLEIEKE